jgi:Fe-S-cluster containining protein
MSVNVQPLREVSQWFDESLAKIVEMQKQKGEPINITCGKGCFSCCDEPLKVLEGEVDLILADMTDEEKEALKVRVTAWLYRAVQVHRLSSVTTNDMITANGQKINAFQYRAMKLTCPLLKDGLCSVYANRPLSCRMHLAVGPRVNCEDLALRPTQKFVTIKELDEATTHNLIHAHVKAGYEQIGVSHLGYFLAMKLGLARPKS